MAFLELNKISYIYPNGHRALNDVSMSFELGECVAIIGQNGAGKTTMAKLMNGLNKPSTGEVFVDGWNTKDYTPAKISCKVGYVFQNPDDQLFNNRVYDEIAFGPKNLGFAKEEIEHLVQEAAQLLQVEDFLEENPYDLPLSVRKFVTAASVIAMDPAVIILDEPTAGQDLNGLECLAGMMDQLTKKGKTVLTITHDMEFVASHFERTIVMAHSNKIADGFTSDIFWMDDILYESGIKAPPISRLVKELGFQEKLLSIPDLISALKKR